ncbi:MAG TPA: zinc metallopeptidase [bacterium]|nr:zinc metallopeptidase [bacterium]
MFFDPLYLMIMLPVTLIAIYAQIKVKTTFSKYSQYPNYRGLTGADVASEILRNNGIYDVRIERVSGMLSDHYSPTDKTLRLSDGVYDSTSLAAIGVAAHEAGHTIQHYKAIALMKLWLMLARPAAIISNAAIFMIMIGMLIGALGLAQLGVIFFTVVVIFQIITLPLELDASNRAKELLFKYNIIQSSDERKAVAAVLNSAAFTYLAAAIASIAQLLYFALRTGLIGGGNNRD